MGHVGLESVTFKSGQAGPAALEALTGFATLVGFQVVPTTTPLAEPLYIDRSDFQAAARTYGQSETSSRTYAARAWSGTVAVAADAHNNELPMPLVFDRLPDEDKKWDVLGHMSDFGKLEVGSLASFVISIETEIDFSSGYSKIDREIAARLPDGVGAAAFRFWKHFCAEIGRGERYT